MRVFVTGAGGFIGRAVVQELQRHGHDVVGLARSDASAEALQEAGVEVHRGDLQDLDSLARGAAAADAVIHLAFHFDFDNFAHSVAIDGAAIRAMGEALAGTNKPLVVTCGTLLLSHGSQLATETTEYDRTMGLAERGKSEDLILSLSPNVRAMVLRLSPTVHDVGDKEFVPRFIQAAERNRFSAYVDIGSGTAARWPAVHRLDAAVLYRLAIEKGRAGAVYHAVAEEAVSLRDTAAVIGEGLGVPLESRTGEAATEALGFLAYLGSFDNPTSSEATKKELGWQPTQIGLHEDMRKTYFPGNKTTT